MGYGFTLLGGSLDEMGSIMTGLVLLNRIVDRIKNAGIILGCTSS